MTPYYSKVLQACMSHTFLIIEINRQSYCASTSQLATHSYSPYHDIQEASSNIMHRKVDKVGGKTYRWKSEGKGNIGPKKKQKNFHRTIGFSMLHV